MKELLFTLQSSSFSNTIACYAALLSTVLGLREIYLSLVRIKVMYFCILESGEPDRLYIYNQSKNNITVSNYELFFSRYRMWAKKREIQMGNGDEIKLFTIAPYTYKEIKISDQDKFQHPNDLRLYVQLSFLGKNRKMIFRVKY